MVGFLEKVVQLDHQRLEDVESREAATPVGGWWEPGLVNTAGDGGVWTKAHGAVGRASRDAAETWGLVGTDSSEGSGCSTSSSVTSG